MDRVGNVAFLPSEVRDFSIFCCLKDRINQSDFFDRFGARGYVFFLLPWFFLEVVFFLRHRGSSVFSKADEVVGVVYGSRGWGSVRRWLCSFWIKLYIVKALRMVTALGSVRSIVVSGNFCAPNVAAEIVARDLSIGFFVLTNMADMYLLRNSLSVDIASFLAPGALPPGVCGNDFKVLQLRGDVGDFKRVRDVCTVERHITSRYVLCVLESEAWSYDLSGVMHRDAGACGKSIHGNVSTVLSLLDYLMEDEAFLNNLGAKFLLYSDSKLTRRERVSIQKWLDSRGVFPNHISYMKPLRYLCDQDFLFQKSEAVITSGSILGLRSVVLGSRVIALSEVFYSKFCRFAGGNADVKRILGNLDTEFDEELCARGMSAAGHILEAGNRIVNGYAPEDVDRLARSIVV